MLRYLSKIGWQCTLALDNIAGQEYHADCCPTIGMTYVPARSSRIRKICLRLGDKLFQSRERAFTRLLLNTYTRSDFDVIFCSSYYYFPMQTARSLSRRWGIPYVVDMRDIAEQWGHTPYFKSAMPHMMGLDRLISSMYTRSNIRMRNRMLRDAHDVVTVSPWHRDWLSRFTAAPVHCIYNGFDELELTPEEIQTEMFRIAYIGRIISLNMRQPQWLFEAVGRLVGEGKIDAAHLCIDFYSEPEFAESLQRMAATYGVEQCFCLHPYVARTEIRRVMAESSILLALGASATEQQHGILGTKVFEAIGMEKPMLLIPSDREALAGLIAEAGIGAAAESLEEVMSFILMQYNHWREHGFTRQQSVGRERFMRRKEAEQFANILESCQ